MKYNPRGIGLVGILRNLPALAKATNQTFEIGFIPHGARPTERPLDRAYRSVITFRCEQRRKQSAAGRVADTDIRGGGRKILDNAGGLSRGNSDRIRDAVRRKSEQLGGGGCRAK